MASTMFLRSRVITLGRNVLYVPLRLSSQHRVVLVPEIPVDNEKTNPILKKYDGDLPEYNKANERHCYFGLGKALLEFESAVCEFESQCEAGERDFKTLFTPLEKARCQLESVWNSVNILHITTDALDRDRFHQLHRRAERAFLTRHDSRIVHKTLQEIKEKHMTENHLSSDEERILDRYLVEYKHQGFELPEKKYDELNTTWIKRLNEAKRDYNFRITTSTERFRSTIRDPNVVRDFPVDVLKAMAMDSSQPTKGPWTVTLHPYIYRKFLEFCPNRSLRWNAYQADVTRGSRTTDIYLNCSGQVKDIRQHRLDQALTLGYYNYAEMSMETKMAGTVENVHSMIASLYGPARQNQEKELESLQNYAETRGFEEDIAIFDIDFFKRKQKRTILGTTDEDLRDFFPLPKVLSGIFAMLETYFDLKIEEIPDCDKKWHQDVAFYRVVDKTGSVLGRFYMDPYIRDDKGYAGADKGWYVPIRPHSLRVGSQPLGAFIMSLPAPGYGKPSLLSFAEVEELLKTFGNMLMHMCATSEWADLSGKTGVAWDALDVSSHFLANMLYIPEVLGSLSGHWSSNEPIPKPVIDGLCSSRHHMAGFYLSKELFKAAYDIAFYTEDYDNESYQDIASRLYPQYMALPQLKEDSFPLHFTEIISGDYPASYYCGLWSRMLAADAFSAMHEVGFENQEEVKKVARRFRNSFLSLGSSLPAAEVFRRFRGRDPSHEALLLSLGLKDIPQPKKKGQNLKQSEATS